MNLKDMTAEQIERAKKCVTSEERMAFIQENGIELSEEQLQNISAGSSFTCWLGIHNYERTGATREGLSGPEYEFRCMECGHVEWYRKGEKPWWA